jgi:AraC-like DNA-binding protein
MCTKILIFLQNNDDYSKSLSIFAPMKLTRLILLLFATAVLSCGGGVSGQHSGADSIYTYQNIIKIHLTEPKRALAMTDTAEMMGLITSDSCNWLRGNIYYGAIRNFSEAKRYTKMVLDSKKADKTSELYMRNISLLASILQLEENYGECLQYSLEGARLAHEAGNIQAETSFNFEAGVCMERQQKGRGLSYMDKGIALLRQSTTPKTLPMLSYYMGQKMRYLSAMERYEEAIAVGQERIAVIDRMAKEHESLPDGYIDEQQARVYSVLAYCQHQAGKTADARKSVEAFHKTRFSENPEGKDDILFYYVLTGDGKRALQIIDDIYPNYLRYDTIEPSFMNLLKNQAAAYRSLGNYQQADLAMQRVEVIADSIAARDKQAQTLELTQIYRTQEKDLQLKDVEARDAIYRLTIASAVVIILLISYLLWRANKYNKVLTEKNCRLYDQIQQREQEEARQMEQLQTEPEEKLTTNQQLFRRLCKLMDDKKPYTDEDLNREMLATMLATNYKYVEQSIRECSNGETVADFINRYRVQQVAILLKTTDDSIGLIATLCGIGSRPTLSRLFRDHYGMSPTEFRQAAKTEAKLA